MSPYHVLSLDGGGIRGLLTARILERIEDALPGFISKVELFAGTSTGGLLALGLAGGMTPRQLREIYQELGSRVFADSLFDQIKDLGDLIGAEYSIQPLKEVLIQFFPNVTLADLQKRVLVATFKLDNEGHGPEGVRMWKMKFFHNYPGPDSDGDQSVVDVGIRTSVAPSFFPMYQGYIDGGVAASNPAMCALAQALDKVAGQQNVQDVALLSMGTGYNPHYLPQKDADWGLVQWAPHMLDIMLEGDQDLVDYQCHQVLGPQYKRVNPVLPFTIGLGDVRYMRDLVAVADQVKLDDAIDWIRQNFFND
jgi:patatin-like phospholipase/acyl hydrolase